MVERGERASLALEPRDSRRSRHFAVREHLQRDVALQSRITGAVDLAHPAAADNRDNVVAANARAW